MYIEVDIVDVVARSCSAFRVRAYFISAPDFISTTLQLAVEASKARFVDEESCKACVEDEIGCLIPYPYYYGTMVLYAFHRNFWCSVAPRSTPRLTPLTIDCETLDLQAIIPSKISTSHRRLPWPNSDRTVTSRNEYLFARLGNRRRSLTRRSAVSAAKVQASGPRVLSSQKLASPDFSCIGVNSSPGGVTLGYAAPQGPALCHWSTLWNLCRCDQAKSVAQ
ncbi:hypothetical protein A0H81_09674 [Grifola frondosa]|uniref:Uncharacterized protein n=1 Tax=Grifola frondosa TaxID=5627 RepID=A0A1C7LZJ1_GRIFR|nr:hypothetical protein A0H81_09674 [Grifola frondosa]